MLQEWKLNIYAAEYERNIDANLYKLLKINKFNRFDDDEFWPTQIKDTIQWFTFITILEHTENITEKNNGLISRQRKIGRHIYKVYQL